MGKGCASRANTEKTVGIIEYPGLSSRHGAGSRMRQNIPGCTVTHKPIPV